ncbi:hypothetical protein [Sphingobacterium suaedae]|uniref:DUF3630 family protein n=1 Tax=Sphingobacterium suaedae TaxID=1686402 RepID=A0ABW5KFA6_9SPHI
MNMETNIHIKIPLPIFLMAECRQHPNMILALLTEDQKRQVQDFVFDNLTDKDGSPEVTDLNVKRFQFDGERHKGSFRLHFQISRRFCCSDITGCNDDYLDFTFDYVKEEIHASAHYFQWNLDN